MNRSRRSTITLLSALTLFTVAAVLYAGPLNPPTGPVTATGPTMILSFPFTITKPGTYRVCSEILVTTPVVGLTINADGVVVDLEGHNLRQNGSPSPTTCIQINSKSVTIKNGTISGWGSGIVGGSHVALERLRILDTGIGNGSGAAAQLGVNSQVSDCALKNNERGLVLGHYSEVTDSSVQDSESSSAFVLGDYSIVSRCISTNNGTSGAQISVGRSSRVTDSSVLATPVLGGLAVGINAGDDSTVEKCNVVVGVVGGTGIRVADRCSIQDCRVDARVGTGGPGGIVVATDCTVRDCHVVATNSNSQTILVQGNRNVIERNTVSGGFLGISVTGTGNWLAGNRVSTAATPYSIGPANTYGAITVVAGAGSIATTNPLANFVY
ncbi:MAG: hypothetical protein IT437_07015 [Phycisphaerales bacterium]|nr:hypothetical protein [Phycisphaerales bacterium]